MKRLLATLVIGAFAMALPAAAADAPAKPAAPAKTAAVNQMDPVKGAFHKKHAKAKLECSTCHDATAKDVLIVKPVSTAAPGPINREVCLGCHQSPAKPAWYGAVK